MTEDRAISLNAVIKAVDEHTLDDGTLDDDISCILEDLPSITLDLTPCDDTVSRKTILNKIKEVCFSKEWIKFRIENGSKGQRDYLFNFIKQLPSVKPQSCDQCEVENPCLYCEYEFKRTIEYVVEVIRVMPHQFTIGEIEKFTSLLNERLDEILEIHKTESEVKNEY